MGSTRVDVVYNFPEPTPSTLNLKQGLEATATFDEVRFHRLASELPGDTTLSTVGELFLTAFRGILKSRSIAKESDCCIVHKPLLPIDRALLEHQFFRKSTGVYSTYDADYVDFPDKVAALFKEADMVYATSHAIANKAKSVADSKKVCRIPPSVDTKFFTPDAQVPDLLQSDSLVLGWLGNAEVHAQNIIYLCDVLSGYEGPANIHLRVLGGGDVPDRVQSSIADLEIPVEILPYVDDADLPGVINSFDVGLAPLRDTEFDRGRSSEKVREYMACGIPVIGTNIGENPHLVPNNGGILVNGEQEWHAAIDRFSNHRTRRKRGKSARRHVRENFSIPVVADLIDSAFETVLRL